jgi:hypothetical protein
MAKQKSQADEQRPRRTISYPTNTLAQCLRLGSAVQQAGGASGPVSKEMIAQRLGVAESASGFYALLSSARTFGIITGSRDIVLTQSARDYFLPTTDAEKRHAELAFFLSPDAFRLLLDRFDGHQIPDSDAISNVLLKDNLVAKSWAPRIATLFLSAASDIRVIDQSGFLRYRAACQLAAKDRPKHYVLGAEAGRFSAVAISPEVAMPGRAYQSTNESDQPQELTGDKNVWVYREAGGVVRLETPDPLPVALWERLTKYVQMLKPATEGPKEG